MTMLTKGYATFSLWLTKPFLAGSSRTFELPSAEITAVVNLVTTLVLLTVVSTILMPILSGSVVLVQRRSDEDAFASTDYDASNSVTNDNYNLAGGYFNSYQDDNYNTNNYYDPYYGYNYNYDSNEQGRLLTFGHPSYYFGDWVNTAQGLISRTSDTIKRFEPLTKCYVRFLSPKWMRCRLHDVRHWPRKKRCSDVGRFSRCSFKMYYVINQSSS